MDEGAAPANKYKRKIAHWAEFMFHILPTMCFTLRVVGVSGVLIAAAEEWKMIADPSLCGFSAEQEKKEEEEKIASP